MGNKQAYKINILKEVRELETKVLHYEDNFILK